MRRVSSLLLLALLLPVAAFAQASIAGTVKDSSGALMPGVTVEASSPALIEKTRTAVTDSSGQYKIIDLRPGTYDVRFTLTGFSTFKRDGLELSGTFVATVNAEMKIGSLEESITVKGETPVVDVQSAKQQQVVNKDLLDSIPTGRTHNQIVSLIPGMSVSSQDVGGSAGVQTFGSGQIHGSTTQDGRLQTDGLSVGYNGGSANMYMSNASAAREIVVSTAGGLGEVDTGAVVVNVVPRDGGNTFSSSVFANYAGASFSSSNYTTDLQNAGLKAPNTIKKVYDFNPMFGGPIVKDRLWFFATNRTVGAQNYVPLLTNANAGNPTTFTYAPTTTQAITDNRVVTGTLRLTAQAKRSKFNVYFDDQDRCVACIGGGSVLGVNAVLTTVEANARNHTVPTYVAQTTWQMPLTSRVLFEAGWGAYNQRWGSRPRDDGSFNPGMVNVVEQAGIVPGLIYRQPTVYNFNWTGQQNWRASVSYVTGTHSFKFGYQGMHDHPTTNNQTYTGFSSFRLSNGVPNQISLSLGVAYGVLMQPTSFYAQDQWTHNRLTLQGGVRYDHINTTFTGGDRADAPSILPPTLLTSGSVITSPIVINGPGFSYDDITGRYAATYDVFGNGKTALKVAIGKYVAAATGSTPLNPISRAATSATRSWTDNGDFVPQCNFANPNANGECGPSSNPAFGTSALNATFNQDFFNGWGHRPYEWDISTSVQQQLMRSVAVNIGYFRRWFGNFSVTNNLAVSAADFNSFSVTAPVDSRLPGGGGYLVSGLYNVTPAKFSAINNYITSSDDLGYMMMHWNGVDVTFNGRWRSVTWQGGTSTGRTSWDSCAVRAAFPGFTTTGNVTAGVAGSDVGSVSPTIPYCSGTQNWLTQVKGLASYVIPRIDVNVAATFQSLPNLALSAGLGVGYPGLAATWNVTPTQTTLGRTFAGNQANLGVNLIEPGTFYGDRTNQLDLRFAKLLHFGRTKTQVGVDIYNVTNSSAVQTYNQTYIPNGAWLAPTSILQARFAKISAQFDF